MLRLDRPEKRRAGTETVHVLLHAGRERGSAERRRAGRVGSDDNVGHAPQHVPGRQRLRIGDVECRSSEPAFSQRVDQRRARAIVDDIGGRGTCDFAVEVADALPLAVICDLMGVPEADRQAIRRLSQASHPLGDPQFGTFDDAYRAVGELIDYGKALLRERLDRPSDDLGAVLAAAGIDEEDGGTFFELLITAGIDTTGAAIAHGLVALCENPDQRTRWQSDFRRFEVSAIEEILRWSTPVVHFRRTATADTELAGQPIAEGDKVVLFYNSANRDETVFEAPGSFDITRRHNPHVTFGGGGPHFCLGAHLARLELKAIFRELFERLPDIAVSDSPVLMHSMFFNGVKSLPCEFTARP